MTTRATRWFRGQMCIAATAFVASGCPSGDGDGDGDGDEKTEFDCEVGAMDMDGNFVLASETTRAELDLGFQGFLFVEVRVRAKGDVPGLVDAATKVTLAGEDPTGDTTPDVAMKKDGDWFMSDPVLLFFNSSTPADMADRLADVVVKLENSSHECTASGPVLLVDDDPCIHTGEEPICPDDTDDTGGSDEGEGFPF